MAAAKPDLLQQLECLEVLLRRPLPAEVDHQILAAAAATVRTLADEARASARMRPAARAALRGFFFEAGVSDAVIDLLAPA